MPTITYTWHTRQDDNVCLICQALEGYVWSFPVVQGGGVPDVLEHPVYGIVWDARGSRSHSHGAYHLSKCRCMPALSVEIRDLVEIARKHLEALQKGTNQGNIDVEVTM